MVDEDVSSLASYSLPAPAPFDGGFITPSDSFLGSVSRFAVRPGRSSQSDSATVVASGRLFRCISRTATVWGNGITEKVVWHVVKKYAAKLGVPRLGPHDLRRSCARLCHTAGGELEQI